ncbi:glycosyl hydrolase family 61-domain-containing protein [Mycena galopus ATCC 62051]|nr:glycosyl hydrolase family 61-domain-containing protein [Mycena galopus ATCC 62051]
MKCATSVLFSTSLVASVVAHGWVGILTIAGEAYKGNQPLEQVPNGAPSVVRQIANNLPVKDVSLPELTCGRSAQPAALVAPAKPGDTLLMHWNTFAGNGNWFHDVGPIMTYLARCNSSCAEFDASEAQWFKIGEQGQDADGNWAQAKLDDGSPAHATLPTNLKAGEYLLRSEIVALHTAQSLGGAEFYVSCSQLRVTGYGTGIPKASDLVRFPGAYHANDKGILIDVYNMKGAYQFPGPPVATLVNGVSPPSSPPPHSSSSAHLNATSTSHTSDHMHLTTQGAVESAANTAALSAATKTCEGKHKRFPEALSAAPDMEVRHRRSRVRHGRPVGIHSL